MLDLYDWEITGAQMNLLSSHDTPRFINMVGGDQSALKLAMLFQMTMPGAPTVYYGDEIGLAGGYDPGCRAAMPWERERWDTELFDFVREAIALRKAHVALRRGTYRTLLAEGEQYAFERAHDGERLVVAFNTAATAATLSLPAEQVAAPPQILFGDAHAAFQDGRLAIQTTPRAGVVIALD
jgi:glycosidase